MTIGWAIFMLVASMVINMAMAPKQQGPTPTAFDDIDFPQAEEGTPQGVIFGDAWIPNWCVLAVGNYRVTEIHAGGGKK